MKKLYTFALIIGSLLTSSSYACSNDCCYDPCNKWDGFYVGGFAGYGYGTRKGDVDIFGADAFEFNYNPDGGLIGTTIGYNKTCNNWLYGLEVNAALAGVDGTLPLGDSMTGTGEFTWLSTAALRGGYVCGNFLGYVKGGLGIAGLDYQDNSGCKFSQSRTGWLVGVGIEWMVACNLSLKAEYNYADFGWEKDHCNSVRTFPGPEEEPPFSVHFPVTANARSDIHTVTLGFNYHL